MYLIINNDNKIENSRSELRFFIIHRRIVRFPFSRHHVQSLFLQFRQLRFVHRLDTLRNFIKYS